ncbi:LysR substrate-binding domain-containing protein [Vibrio sp.]|nr:LysR substrate-binding domain-containing protein [Vibrio sp.]
MKNLDSINTKSLRLYLAVYDLRNFSDVARQEGVSPSMVSRIIHQLEDTLGHQLFYRNTRAIIPTESGRILEAYARQILNQFSQVANELQSRTDTPQGLLRINAPVFFGQHHIAPWLAKFSQTYPNVEIELTLTDDFIDPHLNAADVIFRIGTLNDSTFHARVLANQTYHLAASPDYIHRCGSLMEPKELNQHLCLVYKGSSGPNQWRFRKNEQEWHQYSLNILMSSNNAESLLSCALSGMGIVLFPDWLIGEHLKSGDLVNLLPDFEATIQTEPQYISAIYPHSRHPTLNVRVLIDFFLEIYGKPPYWNID